MKQISFMLVLLFSLLSSASLPVFAHDHSHMQMMAGKPLSDMSVYNLTSKWTTQDGSSVSLSSLRGQPVVVAMAYTSCKDMCPLIVTDMLWIEDQAAKKSVASTKFAFFSFDTDVDTPEHLKDYAVAHGLDLNRWTLFHGDKNAVRELAAALGVRYRRDDQGNFDHSNIITLLDGEGNISYQQIGTEAHSIDFVTKLEAISAPHK